MRTRVTLSLALPFAWLLWGAVQNTLGANPAEALIRSLGDWTLRALCLTLAISPLRQWTGWHQLLRHRRAIGVATFAYGTLHWLAYAWLDQGLEIDALLKDVAKRPFILVGTLAWLLLLPLAATSFNRAIKWLGGKRYAALDDGTPYGKDLSEGAAQRLEAAKKSVVLRQSFDDKTVAFDELAAKLKAENVDVAISTLNDFQALALLAALKKINYTSLRLLGGDTVKTTDMQKGAGIIDGIYATSPVLEAKEFVSGAAFLEKYQAAFKMAPAYGGHYTYDSMYVLSQALQLAKSAKPADITAALHKINGYAPVTGTMKWDEKGEQRYAAVGVYELRRGNWELRMRSDRW